MPLPLRARVLAGAALALASLTASGCGLEAKPTEQAGKPGDAAPAKRALRLYLDDDRCDLMSDTYSAAIDPDPARARKLCEQGQIPVDALVRPGEYRIKDAEVIDGNGVIRVELKDGGIRDYTLIPGGPEKFLVDALTSTSEAEYGQPLRLQARPDPEASAVDVAITPLRLRRVPVKDLSSDEYTTFMDTYYLLRVRMASRSDKPQLVGTTGFQLATKDGIPISTPRSMYTDLGKPLPGVLKPHETNTGDVFFAVPRQVKPGMITFVYGDQDSGVKLTWKPRKR